MPQKIEILFSSKIFRLKLKIFRLKLVCLEGWPGIILYTISTLRFAPRIEYPCYNIHVLYLDTTTKNILSMPMYTRNMNMYISIKTRLGDATVTN